MKWKISIKETVRIIVFSLSVYMLLFSIYVNSHPDTKEIDLSNFSGRILKSEDVKPGTFTINASLREALQWGEDAILSYGDTGIQIWKPDNSTPGVFQYFSYGKKDHNSYKYEVVFDGASMNIKAHYDKTLITIISFAFVVITACLILIRGLPNKIKAPANQSAEQ